MLPLSSRFSALPDDTGLYRRAAEKDACGLAFVATLTGAPTHRIVDLSLEALVNLEHRGATGADPDTGDGAGLLTEVPDTFYRRVLTELGMNLPPSGQYAIGTCFLPADAAAREAARERIEVIADEEDLDVLGWRPLPVRGDLVGPSAASVMPRFEQLVLAGRRAEEGLELDRLAYAVRVRSEHDTDTYFPSLSSRTIVHKGMLTTAQLTAFYPDLADPDFVTRMGLVHSRFSTNTFPAWPLAQPFRLLAHNGEINTVRGNRNRMHAAESVLETTAFGAGIDRLLPINAEGASDSASFDEVFELLTLAGRSLPHALMMMVPEPWENNPRLEPAVRDFYEYHSMLIEPWDGPAALTFSDGHLVGAKLDRNGLRPARWWETTDGLVVLGSEAGVLDIPPARIKQRGRVVPGEFFLVDLDEGRILHDPDVKREIATAHPYGQWLDEQRVRLGDLPRREPVRHTASSVVRRQQVFGYTEEELRILIAPIAAKGAEPLGAMGSDTPIAVLSERPRLLFDYFAQNFAQVTNPPIDSIREEMVTSLGSSVGEARNLLDATPEHARQVALTSPVIDNEDLSALLAMARHRDTEDLRAVRIRGLYPVHQGEEGLRARLREIFTEVTEAIDSGAKLIVLSDRDSSPSLAPIPSLLLVSAVHHHLVRTRRRTRAALVAEAGDVREIHHVALLVGYGASAINPYLAIETAQDLVRRGVVTAVDEQRAVENLLHGFSKGLLKIMSKMGISTVASYRGAQTFEALGLARDVVDEFFTGTTSQLDGVGLDVIAHEIAARHSVAYPELGYRPQHRNLEVGGEYQWRREGSPHLFNPDTVFRLQHSTRSRQFDEFRKYTDLVDDQSERLFTLRGLMRLRDDAAQAIPIEEVEPVEEIVKRFMTGAMSYGSISRNAHETLAIAMNRLGGMSNSGEGGEEPDRLHDPERSSAIKQIASGRFGVTSEYLTSARDIQIKIAQGAKPGEGGQLPGQKMYPWIARTRHATPGIGLISPPPHHDIYSIEDLAQLIHDAKNANPAARIHVKLVSQIGVGTVATGVSKAHADVVLISGHDGGTGASPLNSLKHAGAPWELGLAETQQTLVLNGLRDRITVQVDGQLKTGRDVVIAALLGAEEFGFATAPLVVSGCIMMRVCHLDTCPVGVATQNPELRARFSGQPEFVVTFFEYIAEQVRELLASLGLHSISEAVGRVDLLDVDAARRHYKQEGLDLGPILTRPDPAQVIAGDPGARRRTQSQDHGLDRDLDADLLPRVSHAIETGRPTRIRRHVRNVDRTIGTRIGHEVTLRHGGEGLAEDTILLTLDGTAGQSLGAFLPAGVTIELTGDANDYVGKGLSGGIVAIGPDGHEHYAGWKNVIAGNTIAYGATSGKLFLAGRVGERFGVRNSGATLVSEGVGDHGCEYMTGGAAIVLGPTGANFGAGMSGGTAYVLDLDPAALNTDALAGDDLVLRDVPDEHREFVLETIREHARRTGSAHAEALLRDEDALIGRLTEVTPAEFERVTRIRQSSLDAGIDPDSNEVWNQILEGSRG